MRNRTYGGVRGRKTKVGRKLLRFPPTRFLAESEGFKPPIPERGIPDFESSAIDHSANSPIKRRQIELARFAERKESRYSQHNFSLFTFHFSLLFVPSCAP